MDPTTTTSGSEIDQLFEKARQNGQVNFLYTLVRIDGIQCYDGYEDEFLCIRRDLKDSAFNCCLDNYRHLASFPGPFKLLQNLLNCTKGESYNVSPLRALVKETYPNCVRPTGMEIVSFISTNLRSAQFDGLAKRVEESYRPDMVECKAEIPVELEKAFIDLRSFLEDLLDRYFHELAIAAKEPKYLKLPRSLDVLELLVDEEMGGLNGLRVHFSQGCSADFFRTTKGVFGVNVEFEPSVTFLMMSMEPSSNEYRVNGKRLFELGLPGRYNKLGEWRPLIYPGNAQHLIDECKQLSKDPDVQGALLYMRLTGHRCIEFVVRSNMETPGKFTGTTGRDLLMWKCPIEDGNSSDNLRVYDCVLGLESDSLDEVEDSLASIGWYVNMLFFPYGASYSWRVKYRTTIGGTGVLTPSHDDLQTVDKIIKNFPKTADAYVLGRGIDWYNMGTSSGNIFTKFLCYYVAFESVAVELFDGAELGISLPQKLTKPERRALAKECIEQKHSEMFENDPIKFVEQSYFECVVSLKSKTKTVAATVFGEDHPYLKSLFGKPVNGEFSLSDLRSELAHGGVTLLDKTHREVVRTKLFEMERISNEFLLRVLFHLNPADTVPTWSGKFQRTFQAADPRSILVATTDEIFSKETSWNIRAEWCE